MKFTFTTTATVEAETEEDARVELIDKMDSHELSWELEDNEE